MSTGRPCLFKKKDNPRAKKGCQNEAKHRVILGKGYFIDVCDDHVTEYRILGLQIIPLTEVKVST